MPIVRVKEKFQVTVPTDVREQVGLAVGDLLEAKIEKGKITLTPKTIIDRRIEESLGDFKKGRFSGPFDSAASMIRSLHGSRKRVEKAAKRSKE